MQPGGRAPPDRWRGAALWLVGRDGARRRRGGVRGASRLCLGEAVGVVGFEFGGGHAGWVWLGGLEEAVHHLGEAVHGALGLGVYGDGPLLLPVSCGAEDVLDACSGTSGVFPLHQEPAVGFCGEGELVGEEGGAEFFDGEGEEAVTSDGPVGVTLAPLPLCCW